MLIGVFADTHDHVDNVRAAVAEMNRRRCDLAVFAGDFVSTLVVPHLRPLACRVIGCFGDNEGNKAGLRGGLRILGEVGEPPLGFRAADGTRFVVTHQYELLRGFEDQADVVVYAHTHKPHVGRDAEGRLVVNPGETSGWTYRKPSIAIVDTAARTAEIVRLPEMPAIEKRRINQSRMRR